MRPRGIVRIPCPYGHDSRNLRSTVTVPMVICLRPPKDAGRPAVPSSTGLRRVAAGPVTIPPRPPSGFSSSVRLDTGRVSHRGRVDEVNIRYILNHSAKVVDRVTVCHELEEAIRRRSSSVPPWRTWATTIPVGQ